MPKWTKEEAAQGFITDAVSQRAVYKSALQVVTQIPESGIPRELATRMLADAIENEDKAREILAMEGEYTIISSGEPPEVFPEQIERVRRGLSPAPD